MVELRSAKDVIRLIQVEISYQYNIADVAESAGVCYQTVANIAKGKTKSPHFRTVVAILKAMQYNVQVKSQTRGRRLPASSRSKITAA